MPFGLKTAPVIFQRATDAILASVHCWLALVYLDHIVVFTKSPHDHTEQVRRVLRIPYTAGVTPKLKKCKLFTETIDYFRHVIRPGRLELAEHTANDVVKLELPTTRTELRSFLGPRNVKRCFVPKFARFAAPLTRN